MKPDNLKPSEEAGRSLAAHESARLIFRQDLIVGLALACVGALLWLVVIPLGVEEPRHLSRGAISPTMWPRAIAVLILCAGLLFTAVTLLGRWWGTPTFSLVPEPLVGSWRLPVAVGGLLVISVLVPVLGVPLTSALALAGFSLLMGTHRPWTALILAIALPATLYFFFNQLVNIPVPLVPLLD